MKVGRTSTYANVLDIPEGTSGPITISHKVEPPGTVLKSGNLRTMVFGQKGKAITFPEETRWHFLSEEGHGIWMSDLPIEQRQHDEILAKAHGKVLVGGLGLGYAVVALAQMKRVKEIVVVERSADIIKLVWDATMAKVPERVPVSVVHADLFDYLKDRPRFFTWGFFDIWQGDGETTFHETVVPLRELAHGMVRTVECWNEDIMRAQLFQGMQSRLLMLRNTAAAEVFGTAINIDLLCLGGPSIYQQWSVPFWRWYRDHGAGLGDEQIDLASRRYVLGYGRPEVDQSWLNPVRWNVTTA
jgi:hypothetical protein